jgi:ribosomal protein S18 acetylase RimI-like enzyme
MTLDGVDEDVFMSGEAAVRKARSVAEVVRLAGDDALLAWAAGGREHAGWVVDGAVGAMGTDLSARDRLLVTGRPDAVAALADRVLADHHVGIRITGDTALIGAVVDLRPVLTLSDEYGWMQVNAEELQRPEALAGTVKWLPAAAETEVAELLAAAHPGSEAKPGGVGVRRWAGIRQGGRLVAVAAEAWSAPNLGFLAGVAVAENERGQGLGRTLCSAVLHELTSQHGRAALLVDLWNEPAISLYQGLGMTLRPIRSARHHSVPRVAAPLTG